MRSGAPQAAATTCYVATHPNVAGASGKYFVDCNEASPSSLATNRHEAARLWRASEAMAEERPQRTGLGPDSLPPNRPDEM